MNALTNLRRIGRLLSPLVHMSIFLCAITLLAHSTLAIVADSTPFEFIQPDGTRITLRQCGDEFFHWHQDMNGFTAMQVGDKFVYARLNTGKQLEPTEWVVGKVDPSAKGLTARMLPPKESRPINTNAGQKPYRPWLRPNESTDAHKKGASPNQPEIAPTGTVKNLVILCLFSDHTVAANARQQSDYNTLYNKVGGDPVLAPTGSVRDAYTELSYGQVTIQSTVTAWVTLPNTQAYYAGSNNGLQGTEPNAQTMVRDALTAADAIVDFSQFDQDNDGYVDAIDIIHSGYGAEQTGAPANSMWSQKWFLPSDWTSSESNANGVKVKVKNFHTEPAFWGKNGNSIVRIGVICHETGHFFGLPDLYDTDYTSEGDGSWCLMANSWGFDNSQLHPPHFSAWCKIFLGFVTPTVLSSPGTYNVAQSETNKSIYRIDRGFPSKEYLLIENREPVGLENDMPNGGLAIWHIDDNLGTNNFEGYPGQTVGTGWPQNGRHYQVALLQADGRYDLEKADETVTPTGTPFPRGDGGDVYRAQTVSALGMNTTPNTDHYATTVDTIGPTANRITNVSANGANMSFTYSFPASVLYVDKNYTGGSSNGSSERPFTTVHDAYNAATNGTTIVIRAADYTEAPLTNMTKHVTFDSRLGTSKVK